jgi:hypothetical protein
MLLSGWQDGHYVALICLIFSLLMCYACCNLQQASVSKPIECNKLAATMVFRLEIVYCKCGYRDLILIR